MGHFRRFTSTNFTSVLCRIQENRGASYSFKLCKLNQLLRFSHEGGNVYAFICVFLAFILNDHVVHAEFVRHVIHRVTHSAMHDQCMNGLNAFMSSQRVNSIEQAERRCL